MPGCPGVAGNFRQVIWPSHLRVRELEEDRAREEGIAEVAPELSERLRDEDGAVAAPDVCVGVAGMTVRKSAKFLVEVAYNTVRVSAEEGACWDLRLVLGS